LPAAPVPPFIDTPLLEATYAFAREAYQSRPKTEGGGIEHPVQVARLVREAGAAEHVVAAALLHDLLEDTTTEPQELRERFGEQIADFVAVLTENEAISDYGLRKAALRGQVAESGRDPALIFVADKLARLRTLRAQGRPVEPSKLDHYRQTLRLLESRYPDLPLLGELAEELEQAADGGDRESKHGQGDRGPGGELAGLRDGSSVVVRPIGPDDAPLLARAYERLSEESRRRRFLVTPSHLSPEDLRYLTEIDGRRHDALIALDVLTGELVGEARYVREPGRPDAGEVAVMVVDDWQRRGVGTLLLTELTRRARERGVLRYTAVVSTDNHVVLEALAKLGSEATSVRDGEVELEFEIPAEGLSDRLMATLRWAARGQLRLLGATARGVARFTPLSGG
jgi:RimJ/RimL family protein N-acetyltransferase/predicted HD phosphohydrolase